MGMGSEVTGGGAAAAGGGSGAVAGGPWDGHDWLNPPPTWSIDGEELRLSTAPGSDFWRVTRENFVKDDGHLFGRVVHGDFSARVDVRADYAAQYDQAGLMVRASPLVWTKCGIELDGVAFASVVVTDARSDWSIVALPAVPELCTIEVVRTGEAIEVRCLRPIEQLLRVAPLRYDGPLLVGPMAASPKGPGLAVTFSAFSITPR